MEKQQQSGADKFLRLEHFICDRIPEGEAENRKIRDFDKSLFVRMEKIIIAKDSQT